jgi:hypothetical protein
MITCQSGETYNDFESEHFDSFADLQEYTFRNDYIAMEQWFATHLDGTDSLALQYAARIIREKPEFFKTYEDLYPDPKIREQNAKNCHLIFLKHFPLNEQFHLIGERMLTMVDTDYLAVIKYQDCHHFEDFAHSPILPKLGTVLFQKEDFATLNLFEEQSGFSMLEVATNRAELYYLQDYGNQGGLKWLIRYLFSEGEIIHTPEKDIVVGLQWHAKDVIMLNYSQNKADYLASKNIALPTQELFEQFRDIIQSHNIPSSPEQKLMLEMGLKRYQTWLTYQRISQQVEHSDDNNDMSMSHTLSSNSNMKI